ncbi:MAG: peptidoglycan-binding protein [Candidatus Omnitrophica bacterium]|nr:peptidoglycan-binding protein [Candidatus Omnitrophota bacterium]
MKKILLLIISIFLFSGCDQVYGVLDKEGAQEKKLVGEPVPFEPNPTVGEIQVLLKIYGYAPGKVDGTLGARTREAIALFQKDTDLKVTRKVDSETWKKLKALRDLGLIKDNKINIKMVQTLLNQEGYDPGKIDGQFGPGTIKAIKSFQRSQALEPDGKIGYKTLLKLSQYIAPAPSDISNNKK